MNTQEKPDLTGRLGLAVEAARQAGAQTLELFRAAEFGLEWKSDGSPVTRADKNAEKLIRELIERDFPDDTILGEEFPEKQGTSGFRWVLDPIDGTKAFVTGVPLYTTLVAVMQGDDPQIGVINAPAAGEMVFAEVGRGCWHQLGANPPRPTQVSQVDSLKNSVVLTSSARAFGTSRKSNDRAVFDQLEASCRLARTWGDAFGYLLVATGRAEVMIDPAMNLWDAAALQPVVEEAGGKFFDWQGQATVHSGESIGTNALVADEVLKIVAESKSGH